MLARVRARSRAALPILLFLIAFASVIVLPELGFVFTSTRRAGDFAGALRSHVAWARVIALTLAIIATVMLARAARRDPRTAARNLTAILVLCASIGVAAALPAYDAWLGESVRARYVGQDPAWSAEQNAGPGGADLTFFAQRAVPNATGTHTLRLPDLEKGDRYVAFASFRADDPDPFWRSEVGVGASDPCFSSETHLPAPDGASPARDSSFMRECTARAAGPRELHARWGAPTVPVQVTVGALVQPVRATEIASRVDESLLTVAVVGGVAAALAYAVALRRAGAPRLALAVAPLLACALWGIAALAPRVERYAPARDVGASLAFALLALAAGLAGGTRVAWAMRGRASVPHAVRASAFAATGVAMLAPVASIRVWPEGTPWVILAMLATLLVCAGTLLASDATPPRSPASRSIQA